MSHVLVGVASSFDIAVARMLMLYQKKCNGITRVYALFHVFDASLYRRERRHFNMHPVTSSRP